VTVSATVQSIGQLAVPETATLPIGARAPRFDGLLGVDGKGYGLASFRDAEIVVLIFSSNRCPTAQSYTERMKALQAEYGPRGVQLVAINSNDPSLYSAESYQRMVSHSKANGYTFPYLVDEGQLVARAYGPSCTFHVFVLDRDRRLRYEGRFDDARVPKNVTTTDLANALDDLLDDREVRVDRTQPFGCSLDFTTVMPSATNALMRPILWAAVGMAWLLAVGAELTGTAGLLHHHSLIETGPPFPIALSLFAISWIVMVAAMMLPASLGAIQTFASVAAVRGRSPASLVGFVGSYFGLWAAFGALCFVGDAGIHKTVDAVPWLAAHSYLVEGAVLGTAGLYQFMPLKRRFLEACRHATSAADSDRYGLHAGLLHGFDCIVSSGPLMLVMFAAGTGNLLWMAGLTGVMVYETQGRHGFALSRLAGATLLFLGVFALANAGLPSWLPG
jgi:predicted metal-binding membrane protein/peroxiredoxin